MKNNRRSDHRPRGASDVATAPESRSGRRQLRPGGAATALWLVASLAGLGVGGSTVAASATSKPTKAQIAKTCTQVADALADGPDPDVDPVGYALAQVLPLRQIKTSDTTLRGYIVNLAGDFENLYRTNDKKGTQAAVTSAGKRLDTICPKAF